jgi:hypothetical protein
VPLYTEIPVITQTEIINNPTNVCFRAVFCVFCKNVFFIQRIL